jgi:ribosome maturation factor RimP
MGFQRAIRPPVAPGTHAILAHAHGETCASTALSGRVGLRPLFFRTLIKASVTEEHRSSTNPADLEAEVESRLSGMEPDVEVLLVEVTQLRGTPAVRVFLDRTGGVDHELCARATDRLRDLLRDYAVEVSSPGPERPLTRPDHFRRFVGHRVRVRTKEPIEGRRELKGELLDADDDGVVLAGAWGTVTIPHERIRRSNLVPAPIEVPKR